MPRGPDPPGAPRRDRLRETRRRAPASGAGPEHDERSREHDRREEHPFALRVHARRRAAPRQRRGASRAGRAARARAGAPRPRRGRRRGRRPAGSAAARRSGARRGRARATARAATRARGGGAARRPRQPRPTTRNQNWRWSVTTSTPPIAWNAAASRIGLERRVRSRPALVVKTCSSRPWKKKIAFAFGTQNAQASYACRLCSRAARKSASRKRPTSAIPARRDEQVGVARHLRRLHAGSAPPRRTPATQAGPAENDERHDDRSTRRTGRPRRGASSRGRRTRRHRAGSRARRAGARRPTSERAEAPRGARGPTTANADVQRREPASARTVTTVASGSRGRRSDPPRPPPRPGTRSGRRRSRGSTARPGSARRGRRK